MRRLYEVGFAGSRCANIAGTVRVHALEADDGNRG